MKSNQIQKSIAFKLHFPACGYAGRYRQHYDTPLLFHKPDGTIWATGDSRLIPEQLTMQAPDAILFELSDSEWHFTFEGTVKIANAYLNALLLLCHGGSVDSPDFSLFNEDPKKLYAVVVNPDRIKV